VRWKIALGTIFVVAVAFATAGVLLCEMGLRPSPRRLAATPSLARARNVRLTSFDGTLLAASFLPAAAPRLGSVLVLHGHTDSRIGVVGYGEFFSRAGFDVLLPDARGHGESGGTPTFGLKEAQDVAMWSDWLAANNSPGCVYGYGGSYGASILIQALPVASRICAAVAESPFSSLADVGAYRIRPQIGNVPLVPDLIVANAVAY
jgi:alpha-beta hydrolase superfamily lysophospholipase